MSLLCILTFQMTSLFILEGKKWKEKMGDANILTLLILHKHRKVLFDVEESSEQGHAQELMDLTLLMLIGLRILMKVRCGWWTALL